MTPTIAKTTEIDLALQQAHGDPVYLADSSGNVTHVVVSADTYMRWNAVVGGDNFDIRETYAAQSKALAAVWDDPELDIYNNYDANRTS